MKSHRLFLVLLAALLVLACNFPLFTAATQAPANPSGNQSLGNPTANATASAIALSTFFPTATLIPPTATITATPSAPQVTPNSTAVNCRSGPGVEYDVKDVINVGQIAQIQGKSNDGNWWYVRDPNNSSVFCWVAASVVTAAGNLSGIAIIAPPSAVVTSVTVDASVNTPVFCGGPNAVMFNGTITTNGPTKVQFQWEIRGDKSNTTSPQTINFKSAGTKSAPDPGAYSTDCGHYSITLHVLSPNDISATKKFSVSP
jgi:uncharacterized protein YgiM (DUF1202 family)